MKSKIFFSMFFFFSVLCSGQKLQLETINPVPGFKIEYAQITINVETEKEGNYISIQGILTTDATWTKKVVEIKTEARGWGSIGNVVKQEIELLPMSKKSFFIYCKPLQYSYYGTFFIELGGRILCKADIPIDNNKQNFYNILYLSPNGYANTDYLKPLINEVLKEKDTQGNYWQESIVSVKHISPNNLPEHWAAYKVVDLIIINSDRPFIDINSQENKQLLAILHWLYMGGKVIVSSGSTLWPSSNILMQNLFKIDSVKIHTSDNNSNEPNILPEVELRGFSHPQQDYLIKDLLWSIPSGQGEVIYCGMNLAEYGGQPKYKRFWADYVFKDTSVRHNKKDFLYNSNVSVDKRDFAKDRTPILWLVSMLAVFYLLVVGPLNFSYLRKRNKTVYLIVTIPLIAIIFSVLLLCYGFISKGVTNTAKRISFIHLLENNTYYVKDYNLVSSGSRNLYNVYGKEGSISYILERESYENMVYYRQQKNTLSLIDYPLNLWEMGFFGMDTITKGPECKISISKQRQVSFDIPKDMHIADAYVFDSRFIFHIDLTNTVHELKDSIGSRSLPESAIYHHFKDKLAPSMKNLINSTLKEYLKKQHGENLLIAFLEKEISPFTTEPEVLVTDEAYVFIAHIKSEEQ